MALHLMCSITDTAVPLCRRALTLPDASTSRLSTTNHPAPFPQGFSKGRSTLFCCFPFSPSRHANLALLSPSSQHTAGILIPKDHISAGILHQEQCPSTFEANSRSRCWMTRAAGVSGSSTISATSTSPTPSETLLCSSLPRSPPLWSKFLLWVDAPSVSCMADLNLAQQRPALRGGLAEASGPGRRGGRQVR